MNDPFIRTITHKKASEHFGFDQAFSCACTGITHTVAFERNIRIQLVFAVVALALSAFLQVEAWGWCAVVLSCIMVLSLECINTALEAVVDLVTDDYQRLARIAKDCAAAAVLIASLGSIVVGLIVFVPKLVPLWI